MVLDIFGFYLVDVWFIFEIFRLQCRLLIRRHLLAGLLNGLTVRIYASKHVEQIGGQFVQKEAFLALLPGLEDLILADTVDVQVECFRVNFEVD